MKKITQNLRWLVTLLTMIVSVGAWAEEPTGTITFGTNATKINSASVTGEDSQGNEWTITTEGTTSYTANADYYQVGSSKSPATSITFTTTLPSSRTIKSMSAKFGGFNGTEGTVTMKVGDTTIGEGSLNGTSDVTVNSAYEATGTVLTVTVTGIAKGVKCYYISYTYNGGGTPTPTVPSISVDPATVNATAEETEGTIEVTYENIDPELAVINFYAADGETAATYDWIDAEFDSDNNIEYIISANEGEARTAYLKVYGLDAETNDVYSDLITINQAEYVAPSIATLPFVFDGGRADIEDTEGLTQEGLDSDYGSSPKLKFNSTGDWVLLQIDEVPGKLSFDIKGNSFSGGTFTVQTSADGNTYTDLKTYTDLGNTQSEEFDNLNSDVRYIKWIYTEKVSGNVALGNIKLEEPSTEPSITVNPATVNAPAEETESTLDISYENLDITDMNDFGIQFYDANNVELTEEPDWVEVLVAEAEGGTNYVVSYYMIDNEGEARTAYCKVYAIGDDEYVYSNLITINQAAYVAPPTPVTDVVYKKVTSTDDITDGQYLIVYEEGSVAFNGGLTTLDASGNTIEVVLNDGTIEGSEETEAAEFTINVSEGSLKSASGKYIGVTGNSNGLKTSESSETYTNSFAIGDDGNAIISAVFEGSTMTLRFNKASDQNRFRYFKTGQQSIQLYKKVVEEETSPTVTIGASKWATYVAEDNVTFPSEVSAYTVETIDSENSKVALGEVIAVKKGTPILVYSETPGTYTLEVVAEDDCVETFNNQLKVSNGVTGDGATIYALANKDNVVGFYPVASNVTIPAGKAYLEIIESKAPVKGFFALGELADAINNIAVENANGTIFNIAGQKVQNITKGGLYIVNGKKVFVK